MRFLIFKINNLTMVRKRVISCLWRKHELCLISISSPCCLCHSNNATVSKVSWCPQRWNVFFSFWWDHLLIRAALTGKEWLSGPRGPPPFPLWLDTPQQVCHPPRCQTNALILKEMWMFSSSAISLSRWRKGSQVRKAERAFQNTLFHTFLSKEL